MRIVIAIFVPFILFGHMGLLAGMSFHMHMRNASQQREHKSQSERKGPSDDNEHI